MDPSIFFIRALRLLAKKEVSPAEQSIARKKIRLMAIAQNDAILRMKPLPVQNINISIKAGIQNPEFTTIEKEKRHGFHQFKKLVTFSNVEYLYAKKYGDRLLNSRIPSSILCLHIRVWELSSLSPYFGARVIHDKHLHTSELILL
jgi:hypothetical protein